MSGIFLQVLNLSLVGSWVILLVLLARLLLRKSPRWCFYMLWGVVFLRLALPVFPESEFSLVPAGLQVSSEAMEAVLADEGMDGEQNVIAGAGTVNLGKSGVMADNDGAMAGIADANTQSGKEVGISGTNAANSIVANTMAGTAITILAWLWLAGAAGFGGYHTCSYYKFKRQIKGAVQVAENIYEIQGEHLSFVAGIFKPAIYLSKALDEESRKVVLCHEQVHLKRRDYLIKPAALAIACVHWFNPLVWLAFYMMNKDCEMSCDEKVVSILGEESKKVYSYALLDEATRGARRSGKSDNVCAVLSFGEDSIKSRIKHVLNFRKAPVWVISGTVVVLAVLIAGLLSNRSGEEVVVEEYTGAFAYAVDLEDETYTFAPTGNAEYGMSMGEVLRAENLKKSAILKDDPDCAVVTKILTNASENIEEVELSKKYIIREGYGLSDVQYIFVMDTEDWREFLSMLIEEEETFMPNSADIKRSGRMEGEGYTKWSEADDTEDILHTYVEYSWLDDNDTEKVTLSIRVGIEYQDMAKLLDYQRDERVQDINLFEYAVDLEDEEYAYAPAQVEYGMSPEEALEVLDLDENVETISFEDSEDGIYTIYATETFKHVFPHTEDLVYRRIFNFSDVEGLYSVSYSFLVENEDLEELTGILYDQAVEYMPELSTLDVIKNKTDTGWVESEVVSKFNWVEGVKIRQDGERRSQKSAVNFYLTDIIYGTAKTEVTVRVWYITAAQREAMFNMFSGTPTKDKEVETLPALDWPEYTLEEATEEALTIIHGKVIEKLDTHNATDIWQDVVVEVKEVIKGEVSDELVLYREPSGETNDTVYVYEGIEPLELGEECIFFTTNPLGVYENPNLVMPYSKEDVAAVKAMLAE